MSEACTADNTNHTYNADDAQQTDVLIIGAGLAGLTTALALPKFLRITVLSKAAIEVCSSHYAQGGIAASLAKNDCVADHIADTLTAGAGLCEVDNTANILSAGQHAVQWLCQQGVPFTQVCQKDTLAPLQISDLHLTKEGGHGRRRVAHADDATGRHIMETLMANAQSAANISILPYHEALTLIKDSNNSRCQGALVFDHHNQRQISFRSRAVVLASGGLGQLFKRTSAPDVCVGDGLMMAWQAGCRLANLEFIQFHPTGLALDDSRFLISEALRGEGGRLYCPKTGKRFMLDIDARAELAPRDIVARAIAEQINHNGLGHVHLDVSHLPARFLQTHFPQIYQTLLTLGIDITTDPIPVAPTAHYSCGGVVTCADGLTDVPGLYAAGEVAYTGLHGANRLASNSLLECVVIGRRIAGHLPKYVTDQTWRTPHLLDTHVTAIIIPSRFHLSSQEAAADDDVHAKDIIVQLKALMSSHMSIVRSAALLKSALIQIQRWQAHLDTTDKTDGIYGFGCLTQWQLSRQLQLASLIIQSAYQRCESRGGHYRYDYPTLTKDAKVSVIKPFAPHKTDRLVSALTSIKAC
ncbi:L-aspartate oxidase [Psychrobacter sp. F1192]|uniref:L-aspartate oxidase n=1 Tax=Psychrobacter coccoides TaxID=2818440 RepID=A0ABS3NPM3_9GAMM|nr:L-aspartate oxidase [Psychrobacter coccoides]MBO1531166.1 L-aspartate oxidase [Psychrobacter coccoides]